MAEAGPSGVVLNDPDGYVLKKHGLILFQVTVVIVGFSTIALGHTALIQSVVFFLVTVSAFLVGMLLSRSPVAACFRSEIVCFDTCQSAAIWVIEAPSFNIAKASVFSFI